MPVVLFGQYIPDTLFAAVNGNNVKICDQGALRICTYIFDHEVTLDQNHLVWRQHYAGGQPVYCVCNFDYMVEVGPFNQGEYTVDVYYEDFEWIYIGSVNFVIEEGTRTDTLDLINSSSSGCYWLNNPEIVYNDLVSVSPNPARSNVTFTFNDKLTHSIRIFSITGELVFFTENLSEPSFTWEFTSFLNPGLYLYSISSDQYVYSGKMEVCR